MTKLTHTAHLAGLLLCLVALSTASVTWRRVVKTSSAPVQYLTTEQGPSTTKSAITWRRSTVSRRSTTRQEPPPPSPEEEEDEIEAADSKEEASHVAEDSEPRIKPLVPGSRPGFWMDSTRQKKQSSLLKSGSRRNSLFPTKPSTIAPRSTKPPARFTPLTTTPTTITTEAPKAKLPTTKSRFFGGRNRLTKSPLSLRRTTRVPQTEQPEIDKSPETNFPEITATSVDDSRKDTEEFPSSTTIEEDGSTEPVRKIQPERLKTGLGVRRRPKNNGTRLSWKKNSGRFTTPLKFSSTRTTSVPSTSTQEREKPPRKSTAVSRLRNRTRANRTTSVPKVSWTRNQPPSAASPPTKAAEKKRVEKVRGPTDYLRNRKANKFKRVKITSTTTPAYDDEEEDEENVFTTTSALTEDYEIFTTVKPHEFKSRTTVEPFYLTRDYGQLITAVHDEKIVRNRTRSRSRAKTTESPELPTTETEFFSTTEEITPTEEYQYIESTTPNLEDVIDANEDVVENLVSFNSYRATTEIPSTTTEPTTVASEETTEFVEYEYPTTPVPPPQLSSISTTPFKSSYNPADPGKNAYVVWSMGQNGSGWSYEKQGGQVKWSAINSQSAGDRWSVQGKDEIGESLWVPTRNMSGFLGGSGQKPEGAVKVNFNKKPTSDKEAQRNYTQYDSIDGLPSPPGIRDFTPPSYKITSNDYRQTEVNNEPSLIQTFSLGTSGNGTNYNLYTPLSSPANFDTFQYRNSSNTQEYITVAPEFLEGLYQTTPESYAQYYAPGGYNQEYTVQTPDLSLYPSKNAQRGVSDLSGIPPALVKAVVDAKRWTVVGNGGEEGWSLLGENGQLEWKIHNIDGKWSVTSADDVMKMPIEVPVHTISSGNDGEGVNEDDGVKEVKVTIPQVWRLEDDYEKWKALSAEGATEVDTPKEKRIPNGEYDYDQSEELQDDYYEGEDDYDDPTGGHNAYYAIDKFEDRPLWGKNQMEMNHNGARYSKYGGNIEAVNTKEDAIAAWKSLLAGQISWAPSAKENILPKRTRPTRRYEHPHSIKSSEILDKNVVTHSRRQDYKKNDHTGAPPGEYLKNREANLYHQSQGNQQTFGNPENRDLDRLEENHEKRNNNWHQAYSEQSQQENEKQNQLKSFVNPSTALELEQRQKEFNLNEAVKSVDPKDHAKVNALVNKLEGIQKGGKGRTVIDLSHLVNMIKAKSNSSLTTKNDQSEKGKTQKEQKTPIKNRNEYDHSEISKETNPSVQKYYPQDPQNKYSFSKHERFSNLNEQIKHSDQNKLAYPDAYQGHLNQPSYPVALNDPQTGKLGDTAVNRRHQEKYSDFIEEKYSDLNGYNIRPHKKHHSTNKNAESNGYVEDKEVYFRGTKAPENADGHSLNTRYNYENLQKENVPQRFRPDIRNIQYNSVRKHTDRYNFEDGSPYNLYNPAGYSGDDFRKSDKEVQENAGYNGNNRLHEEYQVVSKPSHHQKPHEVILNQRDPAEGNFNEEITPNESYGVGHRPRKTKSKRKQKGHYNTQISRDNESSSSVERIDQQSKEQREHNLSTRHPSRGKIRNTRRRKTPGKRYRKPQDRYRDEEINNLQQYNQGRTVPSNVDSSEELLLDRYQAPDSIEHKRRFDENIYASQLKPLPVKYRRNEKKKSHKPHHSPPIILSSETEFEDDEDGTKKSRKIIVIDYAGKQKKKSSIDRKDLELIIRNVKNRRAEISEDVLDEKRETNSTAI